MRVALTGTPGTGKTSVARAIDGASLEVVHLAELVDAMDLAADYDAVRDTAIVDLEGLVDAVADVDDVLFEAHYAHRLPVDLAIVLRCAPEALEVRLRGRDKSERSVRENAEAEALDVVLAEAVEAVGEAQVVEIDTTGRTVEEVAADVDAAITGDLEPRVGIVDFTGWL